MATKISPPIIGYWNRHDFPELVWVIGRRFRKAVIKQPYDRVVEQYREDVERNSRHLKVLDNLTWRIDHIDQDNPDRGRPIQHFVNDHPLGALTMLALVALGGVVAVRAMTRG